VVDHHNLTGYSQIVEELDATGAVVATYHYGHDLISQSRLETNAASGSSEWVDRLFVYDGGGHVRALTDLEGNITDTFSYDAYGNLLHPSSLNLHTFYLYRGERWDSDLGQYYLRARFYNSDLGRFHTLDEYEGRTGEPLSLHKYLYAHANPVSGWDPSGRMGDYSIGSLTMGQSIQKDMRRSDAAHKVRQAKRTLCAASYSTGKLATHHVLPVFLGPKRNGGDLANLRDIDPVAHVQLHTLLRRMLQFAGLPAPEIGKLKYLELINDPEKRQLVIWSLRATYKILDKQCSPPAPKLSPDLEALIKRKDWGF